MVDQYKVAPRLAIPVLCIERNRVPCKCHQRSRVRIISGYWRFSWPLTSGPVGISWNWIKSGYPRLSRKKQIKKKTLASVNDVQLLCPRHKHLYAKIREGWQNQVKTENRFSASEYLLLKILQFNLIRSSAMDCLMPVKHFLVAVLSEI